MGAPKQILANGRRGPLNVGSLIILPEGFSVNPKASTLFSQYRPTNPTRYVVGPLSLKKTPVLTLSVKAPRNTNRINQSIEIGANRGRGQIYPNGEKRNNSVFYTPTNGS